MNYETEKKLMEKRRRMRDQANVIERVVGNIVSLNRIGRDNTDAELQIESSNERLGISREKTRQFYSSISIEHVAFSSDVAFFSPFGRLVRIDPLCAKIAEYKSTEDPRYVTGVDPWIVKEIVTRTMREEEYTALLDGRRPIARYNRQYRFSPGDLNKMTGYFEYEVFLRPESTSRFDLVRWVHEDEKRRRTTLKERPF